jgi:hypothetical protein
MRRYVIIFCLFVLNLKSFHAQYIVEVPEYRPAPGQFINTAPWGIPDAGNPDAPTSIIGRLDGAMSLGAFGGYVVFRFENPVVNHPDNPYGVDFVIYGNPVKDLSDPENDNREIWSEPGIVSVMKDVNKNGLPDDIWYELAGSDYFFSTTIKHYEVTYTNPGNESAADVPWVDNHGNRGVVPANASHTQPYYPAADLFPEIDPASYTLSGTCIRNSTDTTHSSSINSSGRSWGYADNTPRATYNGLPDNPYTQNEAEGSGGDAFDIGWAVDTNGYYVDLDTIDFVKVHNGVLAGAGWLGEISTEITGAFDVDPDHTISGVTDMIIIKDLPDTIKSSSYQLEVFIYHQGRKQSGKTLNWTSNMPEASVNENHLLTTTESGKLNLTATLAEKPEITATTSAVIDISQNVSTLTSPNIPGIRLYPNPATEHIRIGGVENVSVSIYDPVGTCIMTIESYMAEKDINIGDLPGGLYILQVKKQNLLKTIRFMKQ